MAADPFPPHHPPSDLEASTTIAPVTPDVMDHAAQHAAELVAEAARNPSGPRGKGGRNRKRAADGEQGEADLAPMSDTEPDPAPEGERQASEIVEQTAPAGTDLAVSSADQPPGPTNSDQAGEPADTLARFHAKAAEALRTNIDASFGFWRSMIGVTSISDAASLNASHIRKQLETCGEQAGELASLARQLAVESLSRLTRLR